MQSIRTVCRRTAVATTVVWGVGKCVCVCVFVGGGVGEVGPHVGHLLDLFSVVSSSNFWPCFSIAMVASCQLGF